MNNFAGKYIKRNGVLEFSGIAPKKRFEEFVNAVPEGHIVEAYYEVTHDDGTLAQLAKVHSIIRTLAMCVGETFENMKLLVKEKAGLCLLREIKGKEYFLAKSFGECSRDELSLAIQAAIEIGHTVNLQLD